MADFEKAFLISVAFEGGYSCDPNDSGGRTKYGISQRAYPNLNISTLTIDEAKAIYRRDYWEACGCDKIENQDVAQIVFDMAINMGVSAAKSVLFDGRLNIDEDVSRITLQRIARYAKICATKPSQKKYFFGWICRALNVAGVK